MLTRTAIRLTAEATCFDGLVVLSWDGQGFPAKHDNQEPSQG